MESWIMESVSRRLFLQMLAAGTLSLTTGCATNPVTGQNQLMLVSEEKEIEIDKSQSPHQFSADYGPSQDAALNAYLDRTGRNMAARTHRPDIPYSFRAVNATYINAYAFPGGSIAVTRGILLKLESEAELGALLGHELGHVNARHTAEIMSKNMLVSAVVGGIAAYAGSRNAKYGGLAAQLGMLGSGILLAHYSRDNERQADALGMQYMVRAGYSPRGMVQLMQMLKKMSQHSLSATQILFATHPMSSERYRTAVSRARGQYAGAMDKPVFRQRYMDNTARLRRIKGAIEAMQKGESLLAANKPADADRWFARALKQAPGDYAALVMAAKCKLVQKQFDAAARYLDQARQVYPAEAQSYFLSGYLKLKRKKYASALADFKAYDQRLAGNPNSIFFKGLCHEGMQQRDPAARAYYNYLQQVRQGRYAQYAYKRLVDWGYIKPKS